ncbi:MAG TPA: hypothetical protein DCG57_00310 [Candidatus Riflebacteria bacterium]|jgi:hypothetical protein|nr:hypothetical protein [Candidatus Riflebacteria bacterium]
MTNKSALRAIVLVGILVLLSFEASAYDRMKFESDFSEVIKAGQKVFKETLKASEVLSRSLVVNNQAVKEFKVADLERVHKELAADPKALQNMPGSSASAVPSTGSVNPAAATVTRPLVGGKGREKYGDIVQTGDKPAPDPNAKLQTNETQSQAMQDMIGKISQNQQMPSGKATKSGDPIPAATDRQVTPSAKTPAKAGNLKLTPEMLESMGLTSTSAHVQKSSIEYQIADYSKLCNNMAGQLVGPHAHASRLRFHELLIDKKNADNRKFFAGIVAMVVSVEPLAREDAVKKLAQILPEINEEAKKAAGSFNYGFAAAIVDVEPATKSLISHVGMINATIDESSSIQKSGIRRSQTRSSGPKATNDYTLGKMFGDMFEDIGNHAMENYNLGTQYGERAGELVGLGAGVHQAYGKMAKETTLRGIGRHVGDYLSDSVKGMLGASPPDPYALAGRFAGGPIGVVGGSIATAAGWLCGSIEAKLAQRGGLFGISRSQAAGASRIQDEKITLW